MKKLLAGVVIVAALGAASYVFLHTREPVVPALPPASPSAPVVSVPSPGPSVGQEAAPPQSGMAGPAAAKAPPVENGLPSDLVPLLTQAEPLRHKPDPAAVKAACMANPLLAAQEMQKPPLGSFDSLAPQVASMLCRRDVGACDSFSFQAGSDSCPNPPCLGAVDFDRRKESMRPDPAGCRAWGNWLIYLDSVLEGTPQVSVCQSFLSDLTSQGGSPLSAPDTASLCQAAADDMRHNGDSFCKSLSAKEGSGVVTVSECVAEYEAFLTSRGCKAWRHGTWPSCGLEDKIRSAVSRRNPAACGGDPLCVAFFEPDCEPEKFYDFSDPFWGRLCQQRSVGAVQEWLGKVNEQAPGLIDELTAYRQSSLSRLSPEVRTRAADRIDSVLADLKHSIALVGTAASSRRVQESRRHRR